MGYRVLADENVERATINYLRKLGHDVEGIDDAAGLELGADDRSVAAYARDHDRLILTQDDDFVTDLEVDASAGILLQTDHTLSAREVGDVVHELSRHLEQSTITLEYVSQRWL